MKRVINRWIAYVSGAVLALFLVTSIIGPHFISYSYDQIDLPHRLMPPSGKHWFGTDELGRDILARMLYGGRISFLVSFVVVSISMAIGVLFGLIAGFFGGWIDDVTMRAADVLLAFPGILLAIALMAVLGPSIQNVIIALAALGWISYSRLARGLTLKIKTFDFVSASVSLGATSGRILLRHILPNLFPAMIVQVSFSFAGMILAESSLSFLGLGVQPPYPSWGSMLNDGRNHLLNAPHLMFFPGLAIFLSVLAFHLLGDALRDRLDPRFRL